MHYDPDVPTTSFIWDTSPLYFDFEEDVQEYFLSGQCPALAYELHKLTGWSIGMLSNYPVGSPDYLAHIFVFDSEGNAIDIKGRRSLNEIQDEWSFCGYTHRFWDLKEFEYEMLGWFLDTKFDKDSKAKQYAKKIVDIIYN